MNESNTTSALPAPLWRRLLALVYELLAVLAIILVTVMLCLVVTGGTLDRHAGWYRAILLLAVAAYFVWSWTRGGQTLGMRPWRLHLRMRGGGPIAWPRAVLRFAILAAPLLLTALQPVAGVVTAMVAPFMAWAVDLAVAAFDRRRRALHDILAGTELLYRPARGS